MRLPYALVVNPCALTTSALVVNPLPPCPPPVPNTQEPDFPKFPPQVIDPDGKVSPLPDTPASSDPILFGNANCKALAQTVADAKEDEKNARYNYDAAGIVGFAACIGATLELFLNPVMDAACIAATIAVDAAANSYRTALRRLNRAQTAYAKDCPKK